MDSPGLLVRPLRDSLVRESCFQRITGSLPHDPDVRKFAVPWLDRNGIDVPCVLRGECCVSGVSKLDVAR